MLWWPVSNPGCFVPVPHTQLDRNVIFLGVVSDWDFQAVGQSWASTARVFPQALTDTANVLLSSTPPVSAPSSMLIFRQKITEILEKKLFKNFGICSQKDKAKFALEAVSNSSPSCDNRIDAQTLVPQPLL